MSSPREGSPRPEPRRRRTLWAGLAIGGLLSSVGCQVDYAGMTLPSGKYMHDDVQYFPSGPEFPWANTQAATQRARMSVLGETYGLAPSAAPASGPIMTPPPAPGAIAPVQNVGGRPTDVNASPLTVDPPGVPAAAPGIPPQGGQFAPLPAGGEVPAPGGNMTTDPDLGFR